MFFVVLNRIVFVTCSAGVNFDFEAPSSLFAVQEKLNRLDAWNAWVGLINVTVIHFFHFFDAAAIV